jgi:exodeoxyribonuclease VII large subunit
MSFRTAQSEPLTVSDLTEHIKNLLEGSFRQVWLQGELSNLNRHRSGHVYLTLKDEGARIEGVVWRSTVERLSYRPNNGDQILVRGRLNVYAPQGGYKLIVETIEPAGQGALQAAFETLKKRLQAEGLFSEEAKKQIPMLPRAVGVVTSATGAARRDIESVIHRRCPQIPIILYPANVQGAGAASQVTDGIQVLARHPFIDVIIVGRGGGSIEDLWAFNDEWVCRAIANCPVPIISAVGHETDITLADFVADRRAPTPSAAAEIAVPVRDDLLYTLDMMTDRLIASAHHRLIRSRVDLSSLENRLNKPLNPAHLRRPIDVSLRQIEVLLHRVLNAERTRLRKVDVALRDANPVVRLSQARVRLNGRRAELIRLGQLRTALLRSHFEKLIARLEALSPMASLQRGLSITRKGNEIVTSLRQVDVGDEVQILLSDGAINAQIKSVHKEHKTEV